MASPPEDVAFDAPLHVGPRFQPDRAGVDGLNASVDLGIPGGFGIGVDGAVKAGEQLRRDFGPGVRLEAQGVSKHGLNCFRHEPI